MYEGLRSDAMARGSITSGSRGFYGRAEEIRLFQEAVRDPRGGAIVVVGQQGMGKTMLLDRFGEVARAMSDVRCGVVREEVTQTQNVDGVLGLLMDQAYAAGSVKEDVFSGTDQKRKQMRSLLNAISIGIPGVSIGNLGEVADAFRRYPVQNSREQFLAAMERIADKMADDARAVFMIDPEKSLHAGSDQDWAIVVKRLPEKIKFVFAQRPDDAIADSSLFSGLQNVVRIPEGGLDVLDEAGFERMVSERAPETKMTSEALRTLLARYERHPYAVGAAIDLLANGLTAEELPKSKDPTEFAADQWKQVQRGGQDAIRLFRAYAALEVPVPDEVVERTSGLSGEQRSALAADKYLGGLLRDEGGARRIYHAILADHLRGAMREDEAKGYHERAIGVYRERLGRTPPDALAARRLALHVREVEGDDAFGKCFVEECGQVLLQQGLLDDLIDLTRAALQIVRPDSHNAAVLLGNLGLVMRERCNYEVAKDLHTAALRIHIKDGDKGGEGLQCGALGTVALDMRDFLTARRSLLRSLRILKSISHREGMANQYGNLSLVMLNMDCGVRARILAQAAIELNQSLIDEGMVSRYRELASGYSGLGNILQADSDFRSAEGMHRKALAICEERNFRRGIAVAHANIGLALMARDQLDDAERHIRESLALHNELNNLGGVAAQHVKLGQIAFLRRLPDAARRELETAKEIYTQLKVQDSIRRVQEMLDDLDTRTDRYGICFFGIDGKEIG